MKFGKIVKFCCCEIGLACHGMDWYGLVWSGRNSEAACSFREVICGFRKVIFGFLEVIWPAGWMGLKSGGWVGQMGG